MKKINHTFAVLAYKNSPYLEECLLSLKNQTVLSNIFISTSTPSPFIDKLAEKYSVNVIVHSKNNGIASDWSFAYKNCKTKYLTLAHQDDIYLKDYTETCVKTAGDTLIVFTDYVEMVNRKIRRTGFLLNIKRLILNPFFFVNGQITNNLVKKLLFFFGNPICCPSIMYNKEKIGFFEFDTSLSMNLDWEATMRLADMKGGFRYCNNKLLVRRLHPDSETTNALSSKRRQFEDRLMIAKVWPKILVNVFFKLYSFSYRLNG